MTPTAPTNSTHGRIFFNVDAFRKHDKYEGTAQNTDIVGLWMIGATLAGALVGCAARSLASRNVRIFSSYPAKTALSYLPTANRFFFGAGMGALGQLLLILGMLRSKCSGRKICKTLEKSFPKATFALIAATAVFSLAHKFKVTSIGPVKTSTLGILNLGALVTTALAQWRFSSDMRKIPESEL